MLTRNFKVFPKLWKSRTQQIKYQILNPYRLPHQIRNGLMFLNKGEDLFLKIESQSSILKSSLLFKDKLAED